MSNYGLSSLAEVLAQIVHFAVNDFQPEVEKMPEQSKWTAAYTCSCFLAQHTWLGNEGVETEWPLVKLRIGEDIPYAERLSLAQQLVTELGGQKAPVKSGFDTLPDDFETGDW